MSVDEYSEQLSPPPLHPPLENLLQDKNTKSTIRGTRYKIQTSESHVVRHSSVELGKILSTAQ